MTLTREQKEQMATTYGTGKAQKNHLDGGLAVQIAGISERIKLLKEKNNRTATHQLMKLKKTRHGLIQTYRRLDKDAAEALLAKIEL